jgi:hypothetical protein
MKSFHSLSRWKENNGRERRRHQNNKASAGRDWSDFDTKKYVDKFSTLYSSCEHQFHVFKFPNIHRTLGSALRLVKAELIPS